MTSQLPLDGRARQLDLRVRGLRDGEQVGCAERCQVALHQHVAELARELGAAQQRVGVVDRAGLLPRARHQLLLTLLHELLNASQNAEFASAERG